MCVRLEKTRSFQHFNSIKSNYLVGDAHKLRKHTWVEMSEVSKMAINLT